jgi:hypothetical protein
MEALRSWPASLLDGLQRLRQDLVALVRKEASSLAAIDPIDQEGAHNLIHFIAFHQRNHPGLITALRERGLSSLEGFDAHLAASLEVVIRALRHLAGGSASGDPQGDTVLEGPSPTRG